MNQRVRPAALPVVPTVSDASSARLISDFSYELIDDATRLKLSSVRALPYDEVRLPLDSFRMNKNVARTTMIHEFTHSRLNKTPYHSIVTEGLAEVAVRLYAEAFQEDMWDACGTDSRLLDGERLSFDHGAACNTSPLNVYHPVSGWSSAAMLLELLGDNIDERRHNFKIVCQVSRTKEKCSNGVADGCVRMPTLDEWVDAVDSALPSLDFKQRFVVHHNNQPANSGYSMEWREGYQVPRDKEKTPWGVVTYMKFKRNANFGCTAKRPMNVEPKSDEFDWNIGEARGLPIQFRLSMQNGIVHSFMRDSGIAALDPIGLADVSATFSSDRKKSKWVEGLKSPFKIDVFTPSGWKTIGDKFYIDDQDEKWMQDTEELIFEGVFEELIAAEEKKVEVLRHKVLILSGRT